MTAAFDKEQQRIDRVAATIATQIEKLTEETAHRKEDIVNIRKQFTEEISFNTDDSFDDYLETVLALRQEAVELTVSQSSHRIATKRLEKLKKMKSSPYFGRIDITEEDFPGTDEIYVGTSSLMDDSGEDFLIYDWRAPVASIYYDFEPGPIRYKTPNGFITGTLEKKYQYLIKDGILQSMFDTSLTIGDEVLQQVLGQGTNKHMNSIVATIQQEQNQVIRHDYKKLLVVHGAAGSGKTSAALQRIAYLLYKYRETLTADQIILFSPNAMFNSYVSNVLPELGEENMHQVTFQEYLNERLQDDFTVETPFEQLEYILTQEDSPTHRTRVASIKFKASSQFFEAIETYRKALEIEGMIFKDLTFRGQVLITGKEIAERFYSDTEASRFTNRVELLKEWLTNLLKETLETEMKEPWVHEKVELLSESSYRKAKEHLVKKHGLRHEEADEYEVTTEELARLITLQHLQPLRTIVDSFSFVDSKAIYAQLFADPQAITRWTSGETPAEWADICRETLAMLTDNHLSYEDATPFLLMRALIQGFSTNRTIKQILIDEAQDYSTFQFEYLKRLFPETSMTVLGDFNQAIFAHASDDIDFHGLNRLYGEEQTAIVNMTRSYRSSKPIIDFTSSLVPNGASIIPFDREGVLPTLTQVATTEELHHSIASKIAALRDEGYVSIAIICKSAEESIAADHGLASVENLKLITKGSQEYEEGAVVIPSYLAKGVEFEAVIIYDASAKQYGDERVLRLFYTACTRAMHELQLYSLGPVTPLISHALRDGLIQ